MAELKTFVFTDISGSVRLKDEMAGRSVTERDMAFIQSILTPHRQRIEARLADFGGRVVSTAGDGHFLVFEHTVQAAQWAVAVMESHRDDPIATPNGGHVEVRMSMHVGVPQIDPGDPDNFVGKTVDYAARLNDYANGAQILVSRSVMAILDDVGLEGVRLHMHGRRHLKGIGNVEVHELLYDDGGPREMRNQPKSIDRQWTVIPTQGVAGSQNFGNVALAGGTALKRVGNYELEELLGSGGMGDVYKGRHVQFGRLRAVKVIKPQFVASGHEEVIRRFYNEIKAAGRLDHKNIVVAIDSSSPTDQIHYLVMEYIDGVSLDELVGRNGPLPIAEACEIIRQAARGLHYIHKNGMVHRDVKPSNLIVTLVDPDQISGDSTLTGQPEGERAVVKILDLGLALLAEDSHDRLTRFDHKAMGTGMYMSPEQWRTTSVDIRADVYSLGCTLYHLLAGNPPFYDSDLRPEKAHEKSAVPPIHTSMQPLPKKLWEVLRTMLEKRPEDRYATPAEVSTALAPFAEGHDLPGLVKRVQSTETVGASMTPTKPGGASKVETWRSRPWFKGRRAYGRQNWVVSKGVPLLLLAAFMGGALWLLRQGYLQERERSARATLPAFARTAATGDLSKEIAARFATLEKLAQDRKLIDLLRAQIALRQRELPEGELPPKLQLTDAQNLAALDDWIKGLSHETGVNVESWFVTDDVGYQVARSPKADTIGGRYHTRDYFHGLGRSLKENETAEPIRSPHLSTVYRSDSSKKLKVAFSVPIWDLPRPALDGPVGDAVEAAGAAGAADAQPSVLGVLAMSVNVADFEVLDREQQGADNEVVLIDLRYDETELEPKVGLILHHPRQQPGQLSRLDDDVVRQILAAKPFDQEISRAQSFLSGYRDPFDTARLYWGAFQPLEIPALQSQGGNGPAGERGWIVLVQQPMYQ